MTRTRFHQTAAALILGAILLLLMSLGVNRWLASSHARRMLTSRFEQAFGRSVEVSYFDLAWFPTPRVEAHEVTIEEDPRFGAEYFLRAEAVGANLRLLSLLAGHLELGTLTFTNPNLNLVRTLDGRWNVESWLPAPPSSIAAGSSSKARPTARLRKIEIEGGRINLRRGADVRPFALENVKGFLEHESPGRWRISLSARPLRSTVQLQEAGTLRLVGTIAGTSARLQPAQLALTWSDAALADASRLLFGNDKGVRGTLQLQVNANTEPNTGPVAGSRARWVFTLGAALSNLHRWDLTSRTDDPPISVRADGYWQPGDPDLTVRQVLVEGEHSKIVAEGGVDWRTNITPFFTVAPSDVSWSDLLAFYRAFSPGLDTALTAEGIVRLNGNLRGWPATSMDLTAQSDGAVLRLGGVSLLELSKLNAKAAPQDAVSSLSFVLRTPAAKDSAPAPAAKASKVMELANLRVLVAAEPGDGRFVREISSPRSYAVRMDGQLDHFERWLAAAKALGHPLNAGWEAEGGLDLQLAWLWNAGKPIPPPTGEMTTRGLAVRVPLLNRPIELAALKVELAPNNRRVTLNHTSAFGAHWQGSILWKAGDPTPWRFDLAADRLDATDLDRWLGPRARPGWLARLFSPSVSQNPLPVLPGTLRARGTLRADTFVLAPLEAQNVRADIELDGRALEAPQLSARFYGGSVSGSLEAKLTANPVYRFLGRLDGVNAAALAATSAALGGRASGTLAGNVQFSAQGVGREALLASLEGRGDVTVTHAILEGLDLGVPGEGKSIPSGAGHYDFAQAGFMVSGREVQLQRVVLTGAKESYQGDGTVDFARRMLLNFRLATAAQAARNPTMQLAADGDHRPVTARDLPIRVIHVSGLLESPRITAADQPARTNAQSPPPF